MSEETSNRGTSLTRATNKRAGLFEKFFVGQMQSIQRGALEISTDHGQWQFGEEGSDAFKASMIVNHSSFFRKACLGGSLGAADSYAKGDWESNDLVALFRLFLQNLDVLDGMETGLAKILNKFARWAYEIGYRNTVKGSRRNISLHYDLGNEFFELMLDPTMTYSCALFESPEATLEEAQIAKYDRILDQLEVEKGHHLLEIGTGWGGFAIRAAEKTGCQVTTTTISEKQREFAQARVTERKLHDRIKIVKQDYRQLEGNYDRVVSIEMIEAVGHEYLSTYFSKISQVLTQEGAALIQAITMPDDRYARYLKKVDYVRARVFPGSCVPSLSAIREAIAKASDMRLVGMQEIGKHYVRTLQKWRESFNTNLTKIRSLGYEEDFLRSWEYYLCYCEAGFKETYTGDLHLLLTKPNSALSGSMP